MLKSCLINLQSSPSAVNFLILYVATILYGVLTLTVMYQEGYPISKAPKYFHKD